MVAIDSKFLFRARYVVAVLLPIPLLAMGVVITTLALAGDLDLPPSGNLFLQFFFPFIVLAPTAMVAPVNKFLITLIALLLLALLLLLISLSNIFQFWLAALMPSVNSCAWATLILVIIYFWDKLVLWAKQFFVVLASIMFSVIPTYLSLYLPIQHKRAAYMNPDNSDTVYPEYLTGVPFPFKVNSELDAPFGYETEITPLLLDIAFWSVCFVFIGLRLIKKRTAK